MYAVQLIECTHCPICLQYQNIQSLYRQHKVKHHSRHNFHYLCPIYLSNIHTRQTLTWQEIGGIGSRRRLSNFAKILWQRLSKWLMQVIGPPRVQQEPNTKEGITEYGDRPKASYSIIDSHVIGRSSSYIWIPNVRRNLDNFKENDC